MCDEDEEAVEKDEGDGVDISGVASTSTKAIFSSRPSTLVLLSVTECVGGVFLCLCMRVSFTGAAFRDFFFLASFFLFIGVPFPASISGTFLLPDMDRLEYTSRVLELDCDFAFFLDFVR